MFFKGGAGGDGGPDIVAGCREAATTIAVGGDGGGFTNKFSDPIWTGSRTRRKTIVSASVLRLSTMNFLCVIAVAGDKK